MDFTRRSRLRKEIKPEVINLEELYPHSVMLYRIPPTHDVTIEEFEELALERLKVLRIFEQASLRNLRFLSEEWKKFIIKDLNQEGLKGYIRLFSGYYGAEQEHDLEVRRRDYISHFILRLAYCRSDDLRRWFIAREMEVFKYKFSVLNSNDIKKFLEINNINYSPLNDKLKNEVKSGLFTSTIGINNITVEKLNFYKVHFTEVLDLVKSRKCFLKNGYAYVNTNDFVFIISGQFQREIETGLEAALRILPIIRDDERFCRLLKGLHTSYIGKDYTISKNATVPLESIDRLSKKSFPLCMRMCHETLREKHHHKHGGRLQYGLFLKGIGVTLEDSLKFWREEFTKIMELDKFEKHYAYLIRHNYGKVGSMINYMPYSCMKIITQPVGAQETHGCPFKIYDQSVLKMKLSNYGLSGAHIQEVASYASKGHYQIACTRYFEITHETTCEQGISHPNQYFELSQRVMDNRESEIKKRKIPASKNKIDKTIVMNANDDELWNFAEIQETTYENNGKPEKITISIEKSEWGNDEDFDITQLDKNVEI